MLVLNMTQDKTWPINIDCSCGSHIEIYEISHYVDDTGQIVLTLGFEAPRNVSILREDATSKTPRNV